MRIMAGIVALAGAAAVGTFVAVKSAQPLIVNPSPMHLPAFVYNVPLDRLTNGVLQSSTDCVHWVDRPEVIQDGADWDVPRTPNANAEFYRAKWELIQ